LRLSPYAFLDHIANKEKKKSQNDLKISPPSKVEETFFLTAVLRSDSTPFGLSLARRQAE